MGIDKDKVRVYEILTNLLWKSVFSLVMVIGFFVVLVFLLWGARTWATTVPLTALEGFLAMTMGRVIKHYFPLSRNADED